MEGQAEAVADVCVALRFRYPARYDKIGLTGCGCWIAGKYPRKQWLPNFTQVDAFAIAFEGKSRQDPAVACDGICTTYEHWLVV